MPICSFLHRFVEAQSDIQDLVDIKGLGTNGSGHVTHNLSLD